MGDKTGISWTDSTWNPWMGCHKVSAGCKNCYMFREQKQYGNDPNVVRRSKTTFNNPLKWAEGRKIFTCSWSDWFIEEADPWRDEAWAIIKATPQHTYQILTKRIEYAEKRLPTDWGEYGYDNVWLGVTVENAETAWRIDVLQGLAAAVRWISWEPALEYVDFTRFGYIDWIIAGAESGPGARPMKTDWVRQVRDDCHKSGIAFFLKQMVMPNGMLTKDPCLDGRQWLDFPREAK